MRSIARSGRDRGGGYILVAVLSVMLLVTGLVAAGSLVIRSAIDTAKVGADDVAMAGLVDGGLEITAYQLFVLKLPVGAVNKRRIRLTGGTIRPTIVDESGKIDLNGSHPHLLASAFSGIGMDSAAVTAVVGRIVRLRGEKDGDMAPARDPSAASAARGAIAPPAAIAAPGSNTKRRGLLSLDDLHAFPEFSRTDLARLGERLTVYNPDGKIDIAIASPEVLAAIPGLTQATLETLLARRDNATKEELNSLQSGLGGAVSNLVKTEPGSIFTVRIDAFSKTGRKKTIDAVVAASKSPNEPYYVLDWRD